MPFIRKPTAETGADTPPAASNPIDDRCARAREMAARKDVAALSQALASEEVPRVRAVILTGLARIASLESADAVLPYLRSDDSKIRADALDALRAMPGAVKPRLKTLLSDQDADVRVLACEIVRQVPGPESETLLCGLLAAETEANVCGAAVEVLTEIGGERSLAPLAQCAARFSDDPFLSFAISVAANRLRARSGP
ncbi:MAG: HEAT repeat domain-containing protein [Rhodospirillaceae bacterium]